MTIPILITGLPMTFRLNDKSVDKAVVLSPNAVDSKALGVIPVTKISGGLKTLLLLRHDDTKIFNASTCGDNCAKWILRIAKESKKILLSI